jgi:hypothetical protein
MSQGVLKLLETESAATPGSGTCIGSVLRVDANGEVFVDFRGNVRGPLRARIATTEELRGPDQPVLLVFEDGDPSLPVVAGVVRESLGPQEPKRSLTLEATGEITIACGKSSITLRSDGRIVVKGKELVSRASGTNKVRGATVLIN